MADPFHESVPDAVIDRIFAVMALCPQHIFQVLTKRSARMREYCSALKERALEIAQRAVWLGIWDDPDVAASDTVTAFDAGPLPNVWLGVSAEDQTRADERIPDLLATPAAVRWVSAEPLLGPIDFLQSDIYAFGKCTVRLPVRPDPPKKRDIGFTDSTTLGGAIAALGGSITNDGGGLDWIVVGGESGPAARPMHPQWAREIRDQCASAGVPFFFKQHGEWLGLPDDRRVIISTPQDPTHDWEDTCAYRVGKKRAGRLLDGREHNAMPGRA